MDEKRVEQISKKDIVDYVANMEIKKSGISGLDKVDVYMHIQQIVKMYDSLTKSQLEAQRVELEQVFEEELELKTGELSAQYESQYAEQAASVQQEAAEKDKEIQRLNGEVDRVNLLYQQASSVKPDTTELDKAKEELTASKAKVAELEGQLDKLQADLKAASTQVSAAAATNVASDSEEVNRLNGELRSRDLRISQLKLDLRAAENLVQEKDRALEQQTYSGGTATPAGNLSTYSYTDDIGEILREARKEGQTIVENSRREGQSIIENARNEAEQEMIKALNVRAKYKMENEMYKSWCKTVESEKRAIDEFLTQLSAQYKNVGRVLGSVKDDVDGFDIGRIYKVADARKEIDSPTETEVEDTIY